MKQDGTEYLVITWLRLFFGAHLLYSGGRFILTGYVPEIPGVGGEWLIANANIGVYQAIKYMEFIFGVMLLTNRFVLLALILEMPATINIFWLNTFVVATPRQLFTGPQELFLNGVLLLAYSGYLAVVLKPRLEPLWLWNASAANGAASGGAAPAAVKQSGQSSGSHVRTLGICFVLTLAVVIGSTGFGYAEYRPLREYDYVALIISWAGLLFYLWKARRA